MAYNRTVCACYVKRQPYLLDCSKQNTLAIKLKLARNSDYTGKGIRFTDKSAWEAILKTLIFKNI